MINHLKRLSVLLRTSGIRETLQRTTEFGLRRLYFLVSDNPHAVYVDSISALAEQHNINICRNELARQQYDDNKANVLIATESPAVVESEDWLDSDFDFHAELSFGHFYESAHFHSLRHMHAGNDYWVALDPSEEYLNKTDLVSTILSEKKSLPGHKMRHSVAEEYPDIIDCYGAGVDQYIENKVDSLAPYRFHVVIENGRYPEYVSEKFFDCLKTNTIPIYWGGKKAVEKLGFDLDGILFFEDLDELNEILSHISMDTYTQLRKSVERNRKQLIKIRNGIRQEFYFSQIRLGSLRQNNNQAGNSKKYCLRME